MTLLKYLLSFRLSSLHSTIYSHNELFSQIKRLKVTYHKAAVAGCETKYMFPRYYVIFSVSVGTAYLSAGIFGELERAPDLLQLQTVTYVDARY